MLTVMFNFQNKMLSNAKYKKNIVSLYTNENIDFKQNTKRWHNSEKQFHIARGFI